MESESAFCGVDPLEHGVALGVADFGQEAVGGVIDVA